jgi:hypothetical protein
MNHTLLRITVSCVLAIAAYGAAPADTIFFDDFSAPDPTNPARQPVSWTPDNGSVSIVDRDLRIERTSPGFYARAEASAVSIDNVSVRTQARSIEGAAGVQLRFTRDASDTGYLSWLGADGSAAISITGNNFRDIVTAQTGFRPTEEDVLMQFDAIGNQLSLYLWRPGEQSPASPALSVVDNTIAGPGTVLLGFLALPQSTLSGSFRFVHVANTHIPEPSSWVVAASSLLGLVASGFRVRP